jgi:hypothetical protein
MTRYITASEYLKKKAWCESQGWTELYEDRGRWYGFPPGSLIAQEIQWSTWEILGFFFSSWILPIILAAVGAVSLDIALLIALSQNTPSWREFIPFISLLSVILALFYLTLSKPSDRQ